MQEKTAEKRDYSHTAVAVIWLECSKPQGKCILAKHTATACPYCRRFLLVTYLFLQTPFMLLSFIYIFDFLALCIITLLTALSGPSFCCLILCRLLYRLLYRFLKAHFQRGIYCRLILRRNALPHVIIFPLSRFRIGLYFVYNGSGFLQWRKRFPYNAHKRNSKPLPLYVF